MARFASEVFINLTWDAARQCPFSDQEKYPPIGYAMLDELHHLFVAQAIEEATGVGYGSSQDVGVTKGTDLLDLSIPNSPAFVRSWE